MGTQMGIPMFDPLGRGSAALLQGAQRVVSILQGQCVRCPEAMRFENRGNHLCRTARLVDAAEGLTSLFNRFYQVCGDRYVPVAPGWAVGVLEWFGLVNSRTGDRLPPGACSPRLPGWVLEDVDIRQVARVYGDDSLRAIEGQPEA